MLAFADDKRRLEPAIRAASIISTVMEFRDLTLKGSLEPEADRSGRPFCSEQYKYLFNTTRIPKIPLDVTKCADADQNNHVIVIRKNQFFKLELVRPDGSRLNVKDIENQIKKIYSIAGEKCDVPVGALTTMNRDDWANLRQQICDESEVNVRNFDCIDSAAFVVCLNDSKPVTKEEHSRECWHGDGKKYETTK